MRNIKIFLSFILIGISSITFAADNAVGAASDILNAETNIHALLHILFLGFGVGLMLNGVARYRKYKRDVPGITLNSAVTSFIIGLILFLLSFLPFFSA
jgi:hypothetical protein